VATTLKTNIQSGYLTGSLLIATPHINESTFSHSVILICSHDADGAMGIMINHIIENISYKNLFDEFKIESEVAIEDLQVHYGGPLEINRGFVIFNFEGATPPPDCLVAFDNTAISSSVSILQDIAVGKTQTEVLLALGYAGWAGGQLENEIAQNSWISVPATTDLIFKTSNAEKWKKAGMSQGIDIHKLTGSVGHA